MLVPALSGLDRLPALPPRDPLDLGLARRRLPVRLLELHARAGAGPPPHDRGLPAAADRARDDPLPRRASSADGASAGASACSSGSSSGSRPRSSSRRRSRSRSRSRSPTRSCPATRARIRRLWRPLARRRRPRRRHRRPAPRTTSSPASSRGRSTTPSAFDGDLLNFALPTQFIWAGGRTFLATSQHFRGDATEAGAYLGIPTLVIIVLVRARRTPLGARPLPPRRARGRRAS